MRSDALDIAIESKRNATWIYLSGPFHGEQAPNIREKIMGMVEDGNRKIVIDMEGVTHIDTSVVSGFLEMLNTLRGKGGDLKFVFRNNPVTRAFAPYRNLFSIFPDARALAAGGFLGSIRERGRILLYRKTGVRLSRAVAIFLLVIICGWFLSLLFIIQMQNRRLREQMTELRSLTEWKQHAEVEIETLRERLRPMEQLGLVPDSSGR